MLGSIMSAPQLALVLGSGGVKSIAALGVAQALQHEGLRPDLIVGCSAGALFGALLAMGLSTLEASKLATELWSREVTSARRHRAVFELLMPRLLGFNCESFALRQDEAICGRLSQAFGALRIEDLAIKLSIHATDAHSGDGVTLERGSLVDALRASIALPFLFSPKQIDGRWLIDGSVSDPLPVAAAAHARLLIAVGFKVPAPRLVDRASRLATRTSAALSNNLMQARLSSHRGGPLISLFPPLQRRIGLFETAAMPELIELGRRSAEAAMPSILAARQALDRPNLAAVA